MYVFKNAIVSILRNKGRNILIGIIILVISAACAITLSIRNSADKIVTAYQSKYNVEATIGMDRRALMESLRGDSEEKNTQEEMIEKFNEIEQVTVSEINTYGDSEYVSNYYYVYNASMDAKDLEEATDSLVKETTTTSTKTEQSTTMFDGGSGNMPPGGFGGGNRGSTTNKKTTTIK